MDIIANNAQQCKYAAWRKIASKYTEKAQQRLEWIILDLQGYKVKDVCKIYEIGDSTFHKLKKRFNDNYCQIRVLEDLSRAPHNTRESLDRQIEQQRIVELRKEYMMLGKEKLQVLYESLFGEHVSCYLIQKMINKHDLYPAPFRRKHRKTKNKKSNKLKVIDYTDPVTTFGQLVHLDTIVIPHKDKMIYIITAIDDYTRYSYAKAVSDHSSATTKDFLYELNQVFGSVIANIHTDNGSEFAGEFAQAVQELQCRHLYSRVRVCKDNGMCERFNKTIQEEWLHMGNLTDDFDELNASLGQYLEFYNTIRPHYALRYLSPLSFYSQNSTMYSS